MHSNILVKRAEKNYLGLLGMVCECNTDSANGFRGPHLEKIPELEL